MAEGVRTQTVPIPKDSFDSSDEAQFRRQMEQFMQDTNGRIKRLQGDELIKFGAPWVLAVDAASNATVGATYDTVYNHGMMGGSTSTAIFATDDEVYCTPFYVLNEIIVDEYVVELVAGGGATDEMKIGIYKATSATDPYPSTLVTNSTATIADITTPAIVTVATAGSVTLVEGMYWVWIITDESNLNSSSVRAISYANHFAPGLFPDDSPATGGGFGHLTAFNFDHSSFEVPATFPSSKAPLISANWPVVGFTLETP